MKSGKFILSMSSAPLRNHLRKTKWFAHLDIIAVRGKVETQIPVSHSKSYVLPLWNDTCVINQKPWNGPLRSFELDCDFMQI